MAASVRVLFRVCFLETGLLWACPAFIDRHVFAVVKRKKSRSGIRGLGIGIRADNGGFREPDSSPQPLLRPEMLCSYPTPPFAEEIRSLAGFPGESGNSEQGPSFNHKESETTGSLEQFSNNL